MISKNKRLGATFLLLVFSTIGQPFASAQEETRSLQGEIQLDVGVARDDLDMKITVRNHSFVVISVFPFIALRPIQSESSDRVVVRKGSNSASFSITDIVEDPVDYTIKFECLTCGETIPIQYYSAVRNRFGLSNDAYIDPADFPLISNFRLTSRGRIVGQISLEDAAEASRDLHFSLAVVNAANPLLVYKSVQGLVLQNGLAVVDYEIDGLDRAVTDGFKLELKCTNCFGRSAITLSSGQVSLASQDQQVDFFTSDIPLVPLPPILDLLL